MKINGSIGTLHNSPSLPIDFNSTTLHSKFIELKCAHIPHPHCHRFRAIFVSIVTNTGNFYIWRICFNCLLLVWCIMCLSVCEWVPFLLYTDIGFSLSSFSSSSFSLLSCDVTILSCQLNIEYTIINLSPTMHKIHTFARSKSVNNNQLFLFVAASLAKVSLACLRSLLFSIVCVCVCVFLSLPQRTFKLGIEVFEGAGTPESIQKRSNRFYFTKPNSQCRQFSNQHNYNSSTTATQQREEIDPSGSNAKRNNADDTLPMPVRYDVQRKPSNGRKNLCEQEQTKGEKKTNNKMRCTLFQFGFPDISRL